MPVQVRKEAMGDDARWDRKEVKVIQPIPFSLIGQFEFR